MDAIKQIEIIKDYLALIESKGHDYAGEDVLLNFKQLQSIIVTLGIDTTKVEGVHIFYILIKLQRVCNLLFNNKEPKNESIKDTIQDFRNYLDLLNCTIHEKHD